MAGPLDNLEEAIRKLQDMYDDPDIVTTADKIDLCILLPQRPLGISSPPRESFGSYPFWIISFRI